MNILTELKSRFLAALNGFVDSPDEFAELVRPSQDPKFGDYQANSAMPLGKQLKKQPRLVAESIVSRLDLSDICQTPTIAGPGFINLRLKDEWIVEQLNSALHDERLGVAKVTKPLTYVIDYSAPNVAKPMHVGHTRSTVIGDALCRVLRFLGHRVISDNHIGDWGTQFGMIIYGYKNFLDPAAYQKNAVEELARIYRQVRAIMDFQGRASDELDDENETQKTSEIAQLSAKHPGINAAVLAETAKLHSGDAENRRLWEEFLPACEDEINRMYKRLDVKFDHILGESFYEDRLAAVTDELIAKGIAQESEGAICVFLRGYDAPMIVRKQDGAFLYATTDLATIRYRMETWKPDVVLYVVDHRQSLHFQQFFTVAKLWGYGDVDLQHISFGTVLGDDGRPFKTRSGDTVGLEGLLDEAVRRALEIVSVNDEIKPDGPELSPERRREVAERVGIAALKYADLSQNHTSDYVFSYDKMLAMNGNTATYMQYAYARVRSIFAKGKVDIESLRNSGAKIMITAPAERALALQLLRFSEALDLTIADYRPNQLTAYLFELANCYSTFFEQCHVLRADTDELRNSRLLLCDLTARTIQKGLELLGIKVVEKM